ncbi:MAG: zinc ABC transporter substrate-binding protein [Rhodothermales bacterium]
MVDARMPCPKPTARRAPRIVLAALLILTLAGCRPATTGAPEDLAGRPIRVVATTSMIADLTREIGGERVEVEGLMGPGVDPHLYKASEGDVRRMAEADIILYSGLHLEGKMTEVFEQMQHRAIRTAALAEEAIPDSMRIATPVFAGNYDPHVWFDVRLWMRVAAQLVDVLSDLDPAHANTYATNGHAYERQLASLHAYVDSLAATVPEQQRVLITSHDAFGYFGRAYGFEVHGLQGLSTATEAGTADVQTLADLVASRKIPAMFVESSVSPRGIEAVRAAVESRGYRVDIGGSLYSDALGDPNGPEGTYIGTVRYNIETVAGALHPAAR